MKNNPTKRPGAKPGNKNALKTGRYSSAIRAKKKQVGRFLSECNEVLSEIRNNTK